MEVFTLNREGELEKIEPLKELPIGTKIYAFGAGMSEQHFCITGPMTIRGQEMCLVSNWYPDAYFSTPRHYFDQYSRPLSKKFGIGFYWDDIENVVYPQSKVEAAKRRADIIERKIAEREEARRLAKEKEIRELPGMFPHLKPIKVHDYMGVRSNILAHLKHCFPNVKFSIKKRSYQAIDIHWIDGVLPDEVDKAAGIFEDHVTDYTGDYRDYNPSNFNLVFGGMNHIFTRREMSEEVLALAKQIEEDAKIKDYEAVNVLRKIWWNIEIPTGAKDIRLERVIDSGWRDEDRYRILFTVVEPKQAASVTTNMAIQLVDYTTKSFAIIGDTKSLKDNLKELGGSFNPRLTCGAGWIFSNSKKEAVVSALGL